MNWIILAVVVENETNKTLIERLLKLFKRKNKTEWEKYIILIEI